MGGSMSAHRQHYTPEPAHPQPEWQPRQPWGLSFLAVYTATLLAVVALAAVLAGAL